jgi:hypothetical protein
MTGKTRVGKNGVVANGATKERDIQRLILDWLAANRIWHVRLNTGAMFGIHKGKRWAVRFGKPGMADIVAVHLMPVKYQCSCTKMVGEEMRMVWIEVKTPKGVQSDDQKRFQQEVEGQGMTYVLARSLEDVQEVLQ